MRFVIYGAGAIGGTIGGRLHQAGRSVVLIARGTHLEALQRDGLELQTPEGSARLPIPAVGSVSEAEIGGDDLVFLTMKTQDTAPALIELQRSADPHAAVVCAQNGVENERLALRRCSEVYGLCVYLPAQHLQPGVVQAFAGPSLGVLDLGRFPSGVDDRAEAIAAALREARFASQARADIMRWKYEKLLANLGNAAEALFGPEARGRDVHQRARAEGVACYAAAGIEFAGDEEVAQRRTALPPLQPVGGASHTGGSSWQSLARGAPSIESDYLNGEIVLLGRLHDVATPVNEALQRAAARMAFDRAQPGSADPSAFEALVASLSR